MTVSSVRLRRRSLPALYPKRPFYKDPLTGLSKIWKTVAGASKPLVPLVPPVARSNIPRSNPMKRKMPIEFLNGPKTKKFRSDNSVPLQRGGSGGQFAAGLLDIKTEGVDVKAEEIPNKTEPAAPTTPFKYTQVDRMPTPSTTASTDSGEPNPLRHYPNPSRRAAAKAIHATFPKGYLTSYLELNDMYISGLVALEFSINRQLKDLGIKTTQEELRKIAESKKCKAALASYLTSSKFDIFALNYLLQAFGDRYGVQLQLGTVQGQGATAQKMEDKKGKPGEAPETTLPLVSRLVGSKYNALDQTTIVWVALDASNKNIGHENPYSGYTYNFYKGIGARKEGLETPSEGSEAGGEAA